VKICHKNVSVLSADVICVQLPSMSGALSILDLTVVRPSLQSVH